jgi:hypothetical protein
VVEEYVKVRVRLKQTEGTPRGEWPWATPVSSTDAGGTYALANYLMFTPLCRGDVVRCELDGDSGYQVVEVVSLAQGIFYTFLHPSGRDSQVVPALEALSAEGYEVCRPTDGWVQVMVPGPGEEQPLALSRHRLPAGWEMVEKFRPSDRAQIIAEDVDFTLDTMSFSPAGPVDYWAPDDPVWEGLGVIDADALALIQSMAASDPRVLATIKAGRHQDVVTCAQRLSVADPRDLPKLDRPLLVEPGE